MKKVGQVQKDGSTSKRWNDYRKTELTPTGWNDISDFENACNSDTVGLVVVEYPLINNNVEFYGWMDATFPTDYAGTTYDAYTCTAGTK